MSSLLQVLSFAGGKVAELLLGQVKVNAASVPACEVAIELVERPALGLRALHQGSEPIGGFNGVAAADGRARVRKQEGDAVSVACLRIALKVHKHLVRTRHGRGAFGAQPFAVAVAWQRVKPYLAPGADFALLALPGCGCSLAAHGQQSRRNEGENAVEVFGGAK